MDAQLVKKFSMLYRNWRFITMFMMASCLYLPCAIWSVDTLPSYFFKITFNILPPTPRVPVSFLWVSHPKPCMPFCPLTHTHTHTHTCYMPSSSFIWSPTQYVVRSSNHAAADCVVVVFHQFAVISSLMSKYLPQHPTVNHLWPMFFTSWPDQVSHPFAQ